MQKSMFKSHKLLKRGINLFQTSTSSLSRRKVPTKLVIFDKDGTLLNFDSMWTPFTENVVNKLEKATGLSELKDVIFRRLGYDFVKKTWGPGHMAEGTQSDCISEIKMILQEKGMAKERANKAVGECYTSADQSNAKVIGDAHGLLSKLRALGVKIAVVTSDSRRPTEQFLSGAGLTELVDAVITGDDPFSEAKPSPANALRLCKQMNVDPEETVMVGDTLTDMGMAKNAGLGTAIAVLSGVEKKEKLSPLADHVVKNIDDVMPLLSIPRPLSPLATTTQSGPVRLMHTAASRPSQDYVIVGAGTAGCVLAARLSEDPNNKTLLLEVSAREY